MASHGPTWVATHAMGLRQMIGVASISLLSLVACGDQEPPLLAEAASTRPAVNVTAFPSLDKPAYLGARTVAQTTASGAFVVADAYVPRLVFFDAKGVVQGDFGREGDGPGEFKRVAALFRVPPYLGAWDSFKPRITLFGPEGQLVRTISTPFFGASAFPFLNHGMAAFSIAHTLWWTDDLLRVPEPLWREFDPANVLGAPPEVGERLFPTLGAGRSGRFYLGWGHGDYKIHVVDTAGRAVGLIQREIGPPARSAQDLEKVEERRIRVAGLMGSSGATSEIYPLHPHFRAFHEDECGRLWVDTYRRDSGATVVDLFSPEGIFVEAVPFPVDGILRDVTSDRAYFIVPGNDDVPGVIVTTLGPYSCYDGGA